MRMIPTRPGNFRAAGSRRGELRGQANLTPMNEYTRAARAMP
jgi:hypothetical protein